MVTRTDIPVVTVSTTPPREVRFDYGRIFQIEEGTGMTFLQLAAWFNTFNPLSDEEQAKPESEQRTPTPQEKEEAFKRLGFGRLAKFVAACLDVSVADLPSLVPPNRLLKTFGELAPGFSGAINAFGEEDKPHPTAAADSAASTPGLGSTSVPVSASSPS
ncbi:MAG: hypothetical protein ACREJD_09370 [Phycisphaerales bacterium]